MRIRVRRVGCSGTQPGGVAVLVGKGTPIDSMQKLEEWARSALFGNARGSLAVCLEGGDAVNSLDILEHEDVVLIALRNREQVQPAWGDQPTEQSSQLPPDQALQKALYGIHVGEQFAETINRGMEPRAILSAFTLAFSCTSLIELDAASFADTGLFFAFVASLAGSCATGFFAVMVMMLTSAKITRLIGRKQFLFGPFQDDVATQLQQLRCSGPHWEDLELEQYLKDRVTATLTRPTPLDYQPQQPRTAHGWLVEDYRFKNRFLALPPLTLIDMATRALRFSMILFVCALSCRIINATGLIAGAIYSILLLLPCLITNILLRSNGTLDDMDNIWKPKQRDPKTTISGSQSN